MAVLKSRKKPDFSRRFFYLQQRAVKPLKPLQALCACSGKYLRTAWWLCVRDETESSEIASQGIPWAKHNRREELGEHCDEAEETATEFVIESR